MDINLCSLNVYVKGALFESGAHNKQTSLFQSPQFVAAQTQAALAIMNSAKYSPRYISWVRENKRRTADKEFLNQFSSDLYQKVKDAIYDKRDILRSEIIRFDPTKYDRDATVNWQSFKSETIKQEKPKVKTEVKEETSSNTHRGVHHSAVHELHNVCQDKRIGYATYQDFNISENVDIPVWKVTVQVMSHECFATAKSKKEAKNAAATKMLALLKDAKLEEYNPMSKVVNNSWNVSNENDQYNDPSAPKNEQLTDNQTIDLRGKTAVQFLHELVTKITG